jgi:hypothetical protein
MEIGQVPAYKRWSNRYSYISVADKKKASINLYIKALVI